VYTPLIGAASNLSPPEFDIEVNKYYSVRTDMSGLVTLNLPDITPNTAAAGAVIRIKFKDKISGFNIKIKPSGTDTIDGLNEWILEQKGQAITLVSDGTSEWEIN
jgi:hypothetical protein